MRAPSRTMPPSPGSGPFTWLSGLILAALAAGFGLLLYVQPIVWLLVIAIVGMTVVLNCIQDKRLDRLAAERPGESICTFARSFDCRRVDTWIIRAVFEELQPYCTTRRSVLPLRRSDELEALLGIDDEELEALVEDMAFRAGRSLTHNTTNPWPGKIQTVGDLVAFLMHQPSTRARAA